MSVLYEDSGYVRVHWGGQGRRRRTGTVIYIGVDRIIHSRDQNYTHNIFWDNISWEISEYVKSTTGHNLYFLSWCKIKSVGCWTFCIVGVRSLCVLGRGPPRRDVRLVPQVQGEAHRGVQELERVSLCLSPPGIRWGERPILTRTFDSFQE